MSRERQVFHKPTFEKIPQDKRDKIFETAIKEFSANGYNASNINTIAAKAGISIGSMYSYFESKEALYLACLEIGYNILLNELSEIEQMDMGPFEALRESLIKAIKYGSKFHELNQLYIDVSTEALSHLARNLSLKIESTTAKLYHTLINQAKENGIIRSDLDTNMASFCIDNIIMTTQFSFASEYHIERFKIYAGKSAELPPEAIADIIIDFIKNGMAPR